jgi:hypothetical protein
MTGVDEQVRQLTAGMESAIDSYRRGAIPLDRLTWELKSRLAEVEKRDPSVGAELRTAWGGVEEVNAVVLGRSGTAVNEEENAMLQSSLEGVLRALPRR